MATVKWPLMGLMEEEQIDTLDKVFHALAPKLANLIYKNVKKYNYTWELQQLMFKGTKNV